MTRRSFDTPSVLVSHMSIKIARYKAIRTEKMLHINDPYQNARTVQWCDGACVVFIEPIATDARMVPYKLDLRCPYLA